VNHRLVFLDLETTGLDSDRHDVWEIGCIERRQLTGPDGMLHEEDIEHRWLVPPDLTTADPGGLRRGRFYERTPALRPDLLSADQAYDLAAVWTSEEAGDAPAYVTAGHRKIPDDLWSSPVVVAAELARLLDGAHMIGAVPDFDARFLTRWLRKQGQAFTAHYHLVDIEAMVAGFLLGVARAHEQDGADWMRVEAEPPWEPRHLYSYAVGYVQNPAVAHTALGDAQAVRDLYDLMRGPA
jgi:hypothetical protein